MRGFARRVVRSGHLLLEPSMAEFAACFGNLLCWYRRMGTLVVAAALGADDLCPAVNRHCRVVDIDPSIASPGVAAGSRRYAARND
jgi:hypothetical protein